eukprot:CAMPEP_0195002218 /NCGR_PEP_ID=MMETSP0326_2-20130528/2330_1 /TAXON_ID=2866 ORGANISM="Crypthecodinium cohnii, Strain Seligo" /NCGR_SAMPLE_ID=MMETSP0326_2 /ASSEMBLY_ACC=CAM_ASM_000348 /LENGTH=72 /DNA_ID=CAMNT_0040005587 /DNA_START=53 /DNA_END=267 /DNA_ORIENTATION=+
MNMGSTATSRRTKKKKPSPLGLRNLSNRNIRQLHMGKAEVTEKDQPSPLGLQQQKHPTTSHGEGIKRAVYQR